MAAEESSHLELPRLETFLAESIRAMTSELPVMPLGGCFRPASQPAPPSPTAPAKAHTVRSGPLKIHKSWVYWGHCRFRHSLLLGRKSHDLSAVLAFPGAAPAGPRLVSLHTTSLPPPCSRSLLFFHQPVDVVLSPTLAGGHLKDICNAQQGLLRVSVGDHLQGREKLRVKAPEEGMPFPLGTNPLPPHTCSAPAPVPLPAGW